MTLRDIIGNLDYLQVETQAAINCEDWESVEYHLDEQRRFLVLLLMRFDGQTTAH